MGTPAPPSAVERVVPAAGWLRRYPRPWLRADVVAGTTAAAVVIPQAMGYATVAGLPVEIGLYTCIVPMVVYAVLGGSRRLSFSTTSTIVALTGLALVTTDVSVDAMVGAAATLTLLVGLALLLFRLVRLGWIVEAVSEATITGLKFAVGFTIIADQLPKLLGTTAADGGFGEDVGHAVTHLDEASAVTVAVSAATIAGLLALKRQVPRVPGPLVALAVAILGVAAFGLDDHGLVLIPSVPTGLPTPDLPSLEHVDELAPFALAIAGVAAARPRPTVVLVDAGGASTTSVTVMDVFAETDQQLSRQGVALWVAALPTRALAMAQRAPAWSAWADGGKLHETVDDALAAFRRRYAGSEDAPA